MNDLTVNQLNQLAPHAAEIRKRGKRVVDDVVEIGRRLTECKPIAGHGNWLPWLDREFGWKETTALNFMRVYEMSKSANFADLSIPVSGLYLLAAPSTPEPARTEVLERTEAGEQLSHQDVKQIVHEHKPRTPQRLTDSQRESERRAMRTGAEALFDHLAPEQPVRGPTQADWKRRIEDEASVRRMVFGDGGRTPLPASATASPEPAPAPKPSTPAAHVPSSNPSAPTQPRFDLNPLGATPQTPVPSAAVAAPAPDPKAKDQEAWENSVLAYMDDATKIIRMWDAAFPGWKAFDPPDHIVRAADQIAVAWTGIASLLKTERSADAAA